MVAQELAVWVLVYLFRTQMCSTNSWWRLPFCSQMQWIKRHKLPGKICFWAWLWFWWRIRAFFWCCSRWGRLGRWATKRSPRATQAATPSWFTSSSSGGSSSKSARTLRIRGLEVVELRKETKRHHQSSNGVKDVLDFCHAYTCLLQMMWLLVLKLTTTSQWNHFIMEWGGGC
jgi:hypothetical protein